MIFLILSVVDTLEAIPLWSTEQLAKKEYQFMYVQDLEVYKGRIYIVDGKLNRVAVFDTMGKYIMDIGSVGQGPGEHISPVDLEILNDTIYIVDYRNLRINLFTIDNKYIKSFKICASDIAISNKYIFMNIGLNKKLISIFDKDSLKIVKSLGNRIKIRGDEIKQYNYNLGCIDNVGDTIYYFFTSILHKGLGYKIMKEKVEKIRLEDNEVFKMAYEWPKYIKVKKSEEYGIRLFDHIKIKNEKIFIFASNILIFDLNCKFIKGLYPIFDSETRPMAQDKYGIDENNGLWGISGLNHCLYKFNWR